MSFYKKLKIKFKIKIILLLFDVTYFYILKYFTDIIII